MESLFHPVISSLSFVFLKRHTEHKITNVAYHPKIENEISYVLQVLTCLTRTLCYNIYYKNQYSVLLLQALGILYFRHEIQI